MQFIGISTFQVHKLLCKKKYWKKMLTLSDLKVTCLKEKKKMTCHGGKIETGFLNLHNEYQVGL